MGIELMIKNALGKIVSPVRRITRLFPIDGERALAAVFRCNSEASPGERMELLKLLIQNNAGASFVITGEILSDAEFIKAVIDSGCELINGGYSGRPFSPARGGDRLLPPLSGYEAVKADVGRLHRELSDGFGYTMRAGMPPGGVCRIGGGLSAYDLYDEFDYQLIAGSMHISAGEESSIADTLATDEEALNSHVVIFDDNCDIKRVLESLAAADYGVCALSELLEISPFMDIGPEHPAFEPAVKLLEAGIPVAFRNNSFCPGLYELMGDLLVSLAPKEARLKKIERILDGKSMMGRYSVYNAYCAPVFWAREKKLKIKYDFPVTRALFHRSLVIAGYEAELGGFRLQYRREEFIRILCDIICATEDNDPYGVFEERISRLEYDFKKKMGEEEFAKFKEEVEAERNKPGT